MVGNNIPHLSNFLQHEILVCVDELNYELCCYFDTAYEL